MKRQDGEEREDAESGGTTETSSHPSAAHPSPIFLYFEAVVRFGSIRKAAESLRVASSALNRRILDLEESLGTALFERLPRGVRLTAAGEVYLNYVRRSLKELRELTRELDALKRQERGMVRIATAESVTTSFLPRAIEAYREQSPGVEFHVTVDGPERLSELLLSDAVDLVLTHEAPEKVGVSLVCAVSHPLCALVVPSHRLASLRTTQLSECSEFPVALPDPTLAARVLLDRALEFTGTPLDVALESNSIEALKSLARRGKAVCFSFQLGEERESGGLVAVPLRDRHCADAKLYFATRRGRVLPVAAAGFAVLLEEKLRGDLAV